MGVYLGLSITGGVVDVSLGLRRGVVGNITCGVMDVGLSDGVDQAGVQGVVHVGGVGVGNGGGVWQGIAVVTQSTIGESVDKWLGGILGRTGQGHGGQEEDGEALHIETARRVLGRRQR